MSVSVLSQVYDEMRRIAIAGSAVAGGDFRLKKLVPALEQAGTKAPVFARVAQAVKSVVESQETSAPTALLELCTLVSAILYTQGETGVDGEWEALASNDLGFQTSQATARTLKPLLEALSTTGGGRLETIKDAAERGAFRDIRLVKPALDGLDDPYPEIADFLAQHVIPTYGPAVLPDLKARFDATGKAGHLRRLALIRQLDPSGARDVVRHALEHGSAEMRVVAIGCLGDSRDDAALLIEQAGSRSKDVRRAAYKALGKLDTKEGRMLLERALVGTDLELAITPIRESQDADLQALVVAEATRVAASLLDGKRGKKQTSAGGDPERLRLLLNCLRGRSEPSVIEFLQSLFERREKLATLSGTANGMHINAEVGILMAQNAPELQKLLLDSIASLPPEMCAAAVDAAQRSLTPDEVYDLLAPYYLEPNRAKGKKKRRPSGESPIYDAIESAFFGRYVRVEDSDSDWHMIEGTWSPRWLDAAIASDDVHLVCKLARPRHDACNAYLTAKLADLAKRSRYFVEYDPVIPTMARIQHPAAVEAVVGMLRKHGGKRGVSRFDPGVSLVADAIPHLPKSALGPLEALLPTLQAKVADALLKDLEVLRHKD